MSKKAIFKKGMMFKVENPSGRIYQAILNNGQKFEDEIDYAIRFKAFTEGLRMHYDGEKFELVSNNFMPEIDINSMSIPELIAASYDIKPINIIMRKSNWKLLVRNVLKGKNTLMTGPSGTGKSKVSWIVAKALNRQFFKVNLGATQDPRATLIGNTFFSPEEGTFHSESEFVKAIQTPNAVILLDELSRAHPEAWNILMTVLDSGQKYLRLDEANGQKTINVASGVAFIATANIGTSYTSTRTLDRALKDRFSILEMDQLNSEEENTLLKIEMPELNTQDFEAKLKVLGKITENVRGMYMEGELSEHFSTRMTLEIGEMLLDGFKLGEALEVTMLPLYDADGGDNSERAKVLKCIQKDLPTTESPENIYSDIVVEDTDEEEEDENPFKLP